MHAAEVAASFIPLAARVCRAGREHTLSKQTPAGLLCTHLFVERVRRCAFKKSVLFVVLVGSPVKSYQLAGGFLFASFMRYST